MRTDLPDLAQARLTCPWCERSMAVGTVIEGGSGHCVGQPGGGPLVGLHVDCLGLYVVEDGTARLPDPERLARLLADNPPFAAALLDALGGTPQGVMLTRALQGRR